MPRCLFCLGESSAGSIRLTDEHVFPAAIGGDLVVSSSSCEHCNHGNSKFEQAFAVELTPIRMLLQIPDRYGKVPAAPATLITNESSYIGRVDSNGSVVVHRTVTQHTNENGQREFLHQFLTPTQREKLKDDAQKNGQQLVELPAGEPFVAEVHIGGQLKVIASQEGLRTAAKIAYVGLAKLVGTGIATGEAFREVRQFIADGKLEGVARIFVNPGYFAATQQGPHQHSITLAARRDKHRVDAIVRLFGELSYFVVLSNHYEGVDFCATLLYDAYRREENKMLFGHVHVELIHTEAVATGIETVWDNLAVSAEHFCRFLDNELARRQQDTLSSGKFR